MMMIKNDWRAVIELISALVAVVAAAIASIQAFVARQAAHGELVSETLKEFWTPSNIDARAYVFTLQGTPLSDWSANDKVMAENVVRQLSHIGFMMRNRYISRNAFLEFWGPKAVRLYCIVEPYVLDKRREWATTDQWVYAEWLARESAQFVKRRGTLGPSRELKRLRERSGRIVDPRQVG